MDTFILNIYINDDHYFLNNPSKKSPIFSSKLKKCANKKRPNKNKTVNITLTFVKLIKYQPTIIIMMIK